MTDIDSIGPDTSFREAATAIVEKPMSEIMRCLEGVRAGGDVEAVHDLRVATRRLRAVISVIAPAFEGKALDKFEKVISNMTDHLGEARDTDVFIEFLDEQINGVDSDKPYEAVGLAAFRDSLKERRAELQVELVQALTHIDESKLRGDADAIFGKQGNE